MSLVENSTEVSNETLVLSRAMRVFARAKFLNLGSDPSCGKLSQTAVHSKNTAYWSHIQGVQNEVDLSKRSVTKDCEVLFNIGLFFGGAHLSNCFSSMLEMLK